MSEILVRLLRLQIPVLVGLVGLRWYAEDAEGGEMVVDVV